MKKMKTERLLLAMGAALLLSACDGKKGGEPPAVAEEAPAVAEEAPSAREDERAAAPPEEESAPPQEEKPPAAPREPAPPEDKRPADTEEAKADEYTRSVGGVSVSKDDFEKDKREILRIIGELAAVMRDRDYESWLSYLDPESAAYWQKPANLKQAQNRLPIKGLTLRNLQDYFKYVFIPSRQERSISEIRYESSSSVKAVQVEDGEDIVFYYFVKSGGAWRLRLPPIEK